MAIEINDTALSVHYRLDAEQNVLGIIIMRGASSMREVADFLRPEHFHAGLHNQLYKVMSGMFVAGSPIDIITIIEHSLVEKVFDNQEEAKGYLKKLVDLVADPSSLESYARIVVDKYTVRSLMYACRDIYDMASAGSGKTEQVLEFAETKIFSLRGEQNTGLVTIQAALKEKIDELEETCKNPGAKKAGVLPSSFGDLDRHIYGLNPSDLILIAGRPGMGKTSFALNVATGAAKLRPDKQIVIFSLEMSPEQLMTRLLSSEARVTNDEMRHGKIDSDGWRRITDAAVILSKMNMSFDGSSNPSIGEMRAKLMKEKNVGLVVIDYLQLMSSGRRDGNRVQEISEITRSLKLMAKDLDVPILLASQLSRAAAQRGKTEKRPQMTDLRDSPKAPRQTSWSALSERTVTARQES
jgi:replicative DNA helicase